MTTILPELTEFIGDKVTEGEFKEAFSVLYSYIKETSVPSGLISLWSGAVADILLKF